MKRKIAISVAASATLALVGALSPLSGRGRVVLAQEHPLPAPAPSELETACPPPQERVFYIQVQGGDRLLNAQRDKAVVRYLDTWSARAVNDGRCFQIRVPLDHLNKGSVNAKCEAEAWSPKAIAVRVPVFQEDLPVLCVLRHKVEALLPRLPFGTWRDDGAVR